MQTGRTEFTESSDTRNVQTGLAPFSIDKHSKEVPNGLSLEQIVNFLYPFRIQNTEMIVILGDEVIPQDKWKLIYPKENAFVAVNVVPAGGGGGGGKNPLQTIISIATLVAAPYLAGAFATNAALAIFGGGVATGTQVAFASSLIRVGVGLIGYVASAALASTPSQTGASQARSPDESPTQFVEGSTNSLNRYGPIPVNLGVNRMFPPQAAIPFTETQDRDQFVHQIFCYGFGNVQISDRKIGETDLSEFTGVFYDDKLNGDLADGTAYFTQDVFQENFSVSVTEEDGSVVRTTQVDTDEFEVDITFGRGLTVYSGSGVRNTRSVDYEIVFAPTGTTDWSRGQNGATYASQTLEIPAPIKYLPTFNGATEENTDDAGIILLDPDTGFTKIITYTYSGYFVEPAPATPVDYIRIGSYRLSGGSYVIVDERASHTPNTIENASDFALSVSGSTITIASGTVTPLVLTATDATAESLRIPYRKVMTSSGQWDIRVTRITADTDDSSTFDEFDLSAIKSITHQTPINQQNISGTGWQMQGSDQLSGTVDRYNVIVKTIVSDYDSSSDEWVDRISSNPASLYRYVLQSPAFVKRLADVKIDISKLEEWHSYCESKGLTYNRIIDVRQSILDVLNDIAAAGNASPHNVEGIYSIIIDNERPIVKGVITPRNSWGYTGNMEYPEIPDALRVTFRNSNKSYVNDEVIVYNDGFDLSTAELYETLPLEFCTNSTLAVFFGRTYYAVAKLQVANAPGLTSLCAFVELGKELDLLITEIQMNKDESAKITAINYAPERFAVTDEPIPAFNSNVTVPIELRQPLPPVLNGLIQSDESVMLLNSDGSYTSRMIIDLLNQNESDITTTIKARLTGGTNWFQPEILLSSPNRLVLTGLIDGKSYDFEIRYKRRNSGSVASLPLVLNGVKYVGASTDPSQVSNFKYNSIGSTAMFEWDVNPEIDIAYYKMKYTRLTTGGLWENSQVIADNITSNRLVTPIRQGTFLIKAVDILGNESDVSANIVSFDGGALNNVVEELVQHDTWQGVKENCHVVDGDLFLTDPTIQGIYYFDPAVVDLGDVFDNIVSSSIISYPVSYLNMRSIASLRSVASLRLSGGPDMRSIASLRSVASLRGFENLNWSSVLEFQYSDDDITYSAWQPLTTGSYIFRYCKFRLVINSSQQNINVRVDQAIANIDMPDRREEAEDLQITDANAGYTVTYASPFNAQPAVNITLQDAETDDRIEYTSKTTSGFTVKVYNATIGGYVTRSFDYTASGYGKVS